MDEVTVQCPYCGEDVTLFIEDDLGGQFVQDCEVCCRPWAVQVTHDERGSPPLVQVARAQ